MAKDETQARITSALSNSAPLLAETAELLASASLPLVGLPSIEDAKAKPAATVTAIRGEGFADAEAVTQLVTAVSQAAPDVALAAPNFTVAATA